MRQVETTFIMTHALRSCRRKVFAKAGFANDKLSDGEKEQFTNCLGKYFDVSSFSQDALRAGLLNAMA